MPGTNTQANVDGTPPATSPTSAQSVYGAQSNAIQQYIKSQPALWAKLQQMQDQYTQASQPTMWDKLGDAVNQDVYKRQGTRQHDGDE